MAPGVVVDGNLLLKLSGQGSVYIRSLEPLLNTDEESTALHDWLDDFESPSNFMGCEPPLQVPVDDLQTSSPTDQMASAPPLCCSEPSEVERALDVVANNSSCADGHSTINIDSDAHMVAGN